MIFSAQVSHWLYDDPTIIGQCLDNNQILRGGRTFIVSARVFLGREPLLARMRIVPANLTKTGGLPSFFVTINVIMLAPFFSGLKKSPLSHHGRFQCLSTQAELHTCSLSLGHPCYTFHEDVHHTRPLNTTIADTQTNKGKKSASNKAKKKLTKPKNNKHKIHG